MVYGDTREQAIMNIEALSLRILVDRIEHGEVAQENITMKNLKYIIYREGDYYVSQCLNIEVASFGTSIDEALSNLKEAVELYLEDDKSLTHFHEVGEFMLGEFALRAQTAFIKRDHCCTIGSWL